MSDKTPQERLTRGRQARELLDHPLVVQAFAEADAELVQAWRHAETVEAREAAWHELQGLQRIIGRLRAKAGDAALAERTIKREQQQARI